MASLSWRIGGASSTIRGIYDHVPTGDHGMTRAGRRFLREGAAALRSAIGDWLVALEHTGSTSVPALGAKPIVDIMAATLRLEPTFYPAL